MAQLERIGAAIEQRWGKKEKSKKKKNGNEEEGSENSPRKS